VQRYARVEQTLLEKHKRNCDRDRKTCRKQNVPTKNTVQNNRDSRFTIGDIVVCLIKCRLVGRPQTEKLFKAANRFIRFFSIKLFYITKKIAKKYPSKSYLDITHNF